MILEFLLGILSGTFTGLIPGIHINLIAIVFLTTIPSVIFITAMAITHTFLNFIPSVFLGAPDEDTAMGILPGHQYLLMGNGHKAILLTLLGSTIAIASLIIIVPIFILAIPKIYPFVKQMMAFFLIWISIFLVTTEKDSKTKAIIIFIMAGFLGIASANLNINQPILPLLTGLFGTSTLINSIKTKTKIPEQKIEKLSLQKRKLIKPTITTILISPICSLLPGIGSSQAAVIGSTVAKHDEEQFLILLGSINTIIMSVSFVTLLLIQKSRTGAAFAISQITNISPKILTTIIIIIFLSSLIAIPLTILLSKIFAKNIHKINYSKISLTVIAFLTIIIFLTSGTLGILVLTTATILGLTAIEFKTKRSFLMGALLIPTILFYLPI